MLKVLQNNKFTRTSKADADISRGEQSIAAVNNKVFMIAGWVSGSWTCLSTVSCYEIAKNTWECLKPKLNIARRSASACTLKGMIYLFCGSDKNYRFLNSIEMISETFLVQNSTSTWQLIEFPQDILTPRTKPAISPLNDTEIAIMGGYYGGYTSDVVVFNTTAK